MIACVGMSTTLHGYIRGQVQDAHLEDALLFFSCSRGHVFDNGRVPCEATTFNRALPIVMRGTCSILAVDREYRLAVCRFIELVREADTAGRVTWQVGSQSGAVKSFSKGTQYFWRKGWGVR